jgi:hypothetical protein
MAPSVAHTLRCIVLLSLVVLPTACNSPQPVLDTPVAPSPPPSGPPAPEIPSPTVTVFSLTFNPVAVLGAGSSRGRVLLTLPAPQGGLSVALSSSDSALAMPASITVPAGADSAEFMATSQQVPSDREVMVTGSSQDRAVSSVLRLWAVLPTFFSFMTEPMSGGGFRRMTPDNATFAAFCDRHIIDVGISGTESWRARFGGPAGMPMQTGTYETRKLSQEFDPNPWFDVSTPGRSCGASSAGSGRFTVREVDVTAAGEVRRFWATFEQHCGGQASLQGDVRVTNVAPPASQVQRCLTTIPSPTSGSSPTFIYYQTTPEGTAERLESSPSLRITGFVSEGYTGIQLFARPPSRSPSPFMTIGMVAGRGQQLVPGIYRVSPGDPFGPRLTVSGTRNCGSGTVGEFEVFEAAYGPNTVGTLGGIERFRARFNVRCVEGEAGISGQLALFNLPNR